MFRQKLRRVGNSYVVTIPEDEVERRGLEEGQLLSVEVHALDVRPVLPDHVKDALDASWERNQEAYRFLADK